MNLPLEIVLIGAALAVWTVVYRFVAAPIKVRLTSWQDANARYEEYAPDRLPSAVDAAVADLEALGFVLVGHWRHRGHSQATGRVAVLEHPQALDVGKVLEVSAGGRTSVTVLFQTRFADGSEVASANSRATVGLPSPPDVTGLWLPEVDDVRRLYRIHADARDALGGGKRRLAIGPSPTAHLEEAHERVLRHWVETGYYYLDEARGRYRPTWSGAVRMTWRLMWPVRPLFRARRREQTARLLRDLGVSVEAHDS